MIVKRLMVAAALAVAAASPAAASVTINLTGGSGTDGTDGNIRAFSSGGINVQASGFSYDGSTLERAWLGAFSGGLGVTNNNEGNGTSNNNHTTDNIGQQDFILLIFSEAVNIASATLTPYNISGDPDDNDARVSYANWAGLFTNSPTAVPLNSGVWAALNAVDWNVQGNMTSPYSTSLGSTGLYGNVWLIGASSPNLDYNDDGFKLKSITVNTAVPEPGTWAMMLLGFGAAGYSMRRSRRAQPRLAQLA